MEQNSLQPTEKSPVQAATGKTSRLFFIDYLRASLVILVVLHHVALVYGAGAPFYYVEPPLNDPIAFLVRIVVPMGKEVLDFPTLAYLPQYFSFFVLGTAAYRHHWFRTLPSFMGLVGFVTAVVAGVLLFPLAFSGHLLSLELTPAMANLLGNGKWQSAVYTLWDSIFAVGMCLGVITLFRHFFNGQGRFGKFLSQHSYAVYVIHIPIVVFLAVALRGIELGPLPEFGMAAIIMVPTCFAVAYIVRKIPRVSRIL